MMESKVARSRRLSKDPIESIETLLHMIDNTLNREIGGSLEYDAPTLLILGVHAGILTISEALFDKRGLDGYECFIKYFISPEHKLLDIAVELHDWRNILAHQLLSSQGHAFGYDYKLTTVWEKHNSVLKVNPKLYAKAYLDIFHSAGSIWNYQSILNTEVLESVPKRILDKYIKR